MAALVFTFVWNDFFWALVLVHSDSVRPVTAGLQSLRGTWLASWQLICAGRSSPRCRRRRRSC
jgi:multiple sugar transport system permease protein